jgi:CubicO group peptidase (beta-lactamase class C family)
MHLKTKARKSILTQLLILISLLIQTNCCQSQTKPSDIAGTWEGQLNVFSQEVRLIYKISVNEDGTLSVLYDSPDYPLIHVPVNDAKLEGDHIIMSVGSFPVEYKGTVGKDIIRGQYSGGGIWFPLNLIRKSTDPGFLLDYLVPRMKPTGERMLNYRYTPPEQTDDGWETADALSMAIDTGIIATGIRRTLKGDFPNLHSILMVKDGKLVVEEYFYCFSRNKPHQIASISKIMPAAAIGIALNQGLIKDINTPLSQLLPEYKDLFTTGEKSSLTLYHLLTMTTGLQWDEHAFSYLDPRNDLAIMKRSPDRLRNLFERPLAYHPGERFVYNTGCVIALEEIVQKVTKVHLVVNVQNEIFTPMGISNYKWDDGYQMLPRDMAKLGRLFQCRGEYSTTRILPAAWVDSALQLDQHTPWKYFNHWQPITHFVNGIPINGRLAGGWGGQSITILPDLNVIIVLTAANQLEPTDYDVSIRDYLLPAVLTPEYLKKHPEVKQSRIKETKNLEWEMRWDTEMGCLKACAKSLNRTVSDAQLYGGTGVGFLINIDERAEAKSMAVWNKQRMYELCRNLGFSVEAVWSHKSSKDFAATQKLVWDRVRKEIDSGNACYGFHLDSPIRYLIIGYDDHGYYYEGWGAEKGKGPVAWNDLGQTDIGLLGMHFVRPVNQKAPLKTIVKDAFQFVLEFSAYSRWVPGDCKAGPEGYDRWISLFEAGKEDGYGVSYNAAEFAEARKYAVQFLEEAKAGLGKEFTPLFDRALRYYLLATHNMEKISQLFPHSLASTEPSIGLKDPKKVQEAIKYLRAAKDAETEGLKVLDDIVEKL